MLTNRTLDRIDRIVLDTIMPMLAYGSVIAFLAMVINTFW